MASHFQPATRPRTLANVLADLEEALGDYHAALDADDADAEDRATEAETRVDDLRDEFAERFAASTGLKLGDVLHARERAVL